MDKLKKDLAFLYLGRNLVVTLVITIFSFCYDMMSYYHYSAIGALKYVLSNNYSLVYFALMWILNYILFEIYKILSDSFKDHLKVTIKDQSLQIFGLVFPIVLFIIIWFIDMSLLFKVNAILLSIFMFARAIKEEIKIRTKK